MRPQKKTNKHLEDEPTYKYKNVNICEKNDVTAVFNQYKPDAVIHLAAESHVDRSIDGPKAFLSTNIIGTYNLLEASRDYLKIDSSNNNFRFLHVSTDEVYGSLSETGQFTEESAYSPNSPYSATKASSDHLVSAWHKTFNLPTITTNCSNNYGPYQFPEKMIPSAILNAINGGPILIYGTGENVRDWLYVEDHAEALLQILNKSAVGERFNIGGNNEISNNNLINKICEKLDEKIPKSTSYKSQIKYVEDRPGHDLRYAINNTKIKNKIGWRPSLSFGRGLDLTIEWYLKNTEWWEDLYKNEIFIERQGIIR
jgi:dTDP-glucose 4,6-dehydratase